MLGSSRNWGTAGRDLAAIRRTYALDMRDHGGSPHAEPMTYEAMAADVLAWLDAKGIARAELIGHSMGGKVAMMLACRHPNRVERLIVVDMAPKGYHWPEHHQEFAAMNELDLQTLTSRADAEARFEARVPSLSMRKFLSTNLERSADGTWSWVIDLPAISAALPELERDPLGPGETYAGPALFIAGGKSGYVKPEDHARIRQVFPAARIKVLPESGHNPHFDAREAFLQLLQ